MPARRSRWRSYLLLARVSNLPTVWTNVLAGMVAVSVPLDAPTWLRVAAAVSLFYCGGMFLNDAFDAAFDSRERPGRPIPAGDVARSEAFAVGGAMMAAGELLLIPNGRSLLFGGLLGAAILLYNYRHKAVAAAPLVMGACRGLVYCIAAAAASGFVSAAAVVGAVIMGTYIVALTVVARMSGPKARWRVPLLLAGICLVDAAFIAVMSGSIPLVLVAACGFLLTLFLQRFVPGD